MKASRAKRSEFVPRPIECRTRDWGPLGRLDSTVFVASTLVCVAFILWGIVDTSGLDRLAGAGLVFSGTSPDGHLVEFVELPREVHPYYVGTQAHPEFRSRPTRGHPLFVGLVRAALDRQAQA